MPLTRKQAVEVYNAFVQPPIVGSHGEDHVYGDSPAAALARFLDLPMYVSESKSQVQDERRKKVAGFLHEMADALEIPDEPTPPAPPINYPKRFIA